MLEEPFSILPLAAVCAEILANVTQVMRSDEACYQYAWSLHSNEQLSRWRETELTCDGPFEMCEVSHIHAALLELMQEHEDSGVSMVCTSSLHVLSWRASSCLAANGQACCREACCRHCLHKVFCRHFCCRHFCCRHLPTQTRNTDPQRNVDTERRMREYILEQLSICCCDMCALARLVRSDLNKPRRLSNVVVLCRAPSSNACFP